MNLKESLLEFKESCRCCLRDLKDNAIDITNHVERMFFEFTSTLLATSDHLSTKICSSCHSLITQHLTTKRIFVDNQTKLHNLLQKSESSFDVYVKCEVLETPVETEVTTCETKEDQINGELLKNENMSKSEHVQQHRRPLVASRSQKPSHKEINSLKSIKGYFYCDKCSHKCAKKHSLMIHKHKVHDGPVPQKEFICEQCSKEFHLKESLKRHMARHNNDRRFVCDHCAHSTHAKADLGNHLKTHLERPTYRCTIDGCDTTFKYIFLFREHQKFVHFGSTPFSCTLCPKTFFRKNRLETHIKLVHQKWRPFKCEIEGCNSSFSSNSDVKRHQRNIHKINVSK